MKILFYSQHVLGIGHFIRSMELVKHLAPHEVVFLEGGEALVDYRPPPHVRRVLLPPIMMDEQFKELDLKGAAEAQVKTRRKDIVLATYEALQPDVLITELFPFGRKKFRFELQPLLERIQKNGRRTGVVCSLRDILVEKNDQDEYELRVLETLNAHYDLLLIHSDPRLIRLDESFSRVAAITVPVRYTGFVARPAPERMPSPEGAGSSLILASTGGGKVGAHFLMSIVRALEFIGDVELQLRIFRGPFMHPEDVLHLEELASRDPRVVICPFSHDFPNELAGADLLLSMAGYNTCMDIISSGVKALVYPFPQNREQMWRANKLEKLGILRVLHDLDSRVLSRRIRAALKEPTKGITAAPDTSGGSKTANLIRERFES